MSGEEEENAAELKIGDGTSLFSSPYPPLCTSKLGFLCLIELILIQYDLIELNCIENPLII
jgi:hypothetical protein